MVNFYYLVNKSPDKPAKEGRQTWKKKLNTKAVKLK